MFDYNKWRHKHWQKGFDEGSQWAMDTFAFIIEMHLLMGQDLETAYNNCKTTMVNDKNLEYRLNAWKESNV